MNVDDGVLALGAALLGAAAAHWLEKSARGEERAEARRTREAQISVEAYALRRQLIQWLRDTQGLDRSVERAQGWAKKVQRHFDIAESRAQRIATTAADASSERATAARQAYVFFYEATGLVNAAAAGEYIVLQSKTEPSKVRVREGAADLMEEARTLLRRCVDELEAVIDEGLKEAEKALPPPADVLIESEPDRPEIEG